MQKTNELKPKTPRLVTKWYELPEERRIEFTYSKYTIEDFWNWWSDKKSYWMEIRTIDWKFAKEMGVKLNIPYSHTGVFVSNYLDLKKSIAYSRFKQQNIWFGIQPRKYNYTKWGSKRLSGGDHFVDCIKFVFVDIDRKVKLKKAESEELEECDKIADIVINRFRESGFGKKYMKICSGNGIQLLFALDVPIDMPKVEIVPFTDHDGKKNYVYVENDEFDKVKSLLRESFGKHMIKYINRYCIENVINNVEIDKASFRVAQVGALPVTKNFKYGGYTWRGIVEMVGGKENTGLSDYILMFEDDIKNFKKNNMFTPSKKSISADKRLIKGRLEENKLVQFMLNTDMPRGMRNNYIWFQLKCLIRDCQVDLYSEEFRRLHKQLEVATGDRLTLNLPDIKYKFSENIVNSFCVQNLIPPIYPMWPEKVKKLDNKLENFEWGNIELVHAVETRMSGDSIIEDMKRCKNRLEEGSFENVDIVARFLKGCIKLYGEEASRFYVKYLFPKFFNYE